jgi:hypothetical protein
MRLYSHPAVLYPWLVFESEFRINSFDLFLLMAFAAASCLTEEDTFLVLYDIYRGHCEYDEVRRAEER